MLSCPQSENLNKISETVEDKCDKLVGVIDHAHYAST